MVEMHGHSRTTTRNLVYDERAAGLGDTRATESDADVVTEAIAICADATRA